jgi:hypothetical protein
MLTELYPVRQGLFDLRARNQDIFRDSIGSPPKNPTLPKRWLLTHEVAIGTKHFFCIIIEIGRHPHLDMHEKIPPSPPLESRHALLPDSVHSFWLRSRRYLELLCSTVEQWYLKIRSERGLSEPDHHSMMEVIANALETVVSFDTDLNVDVPCRSSSLASAALLVQSESGTRVDTLGNLNGQFAFASDPSLTTAHRAWMVDQLPRT